MADERYDRQELLFGSLGQEAIARARVMICGVGGLGSHLAQQLAYLGVLRFVLVDHDVADESNLNRLIGMLPGDVESKKVDIVERMISAIQPEADVRSMDVALPEGETPAQLAECSVVIGCFDKETPRLVATDAASSARVPYVDLASEVLPTGSDLVYGGRVCVAGVGKGCLQCLDLIDLDELARERMSPEQRQDHDRIYGIDRDDLHGSGPSVVTLNGVVASLAAMEVMCLLTGLREPRRQLTYRGERGVVMADATDGRNGCPYCAPAGLRAVLGR